MIFTWLSVTEAGVPAGGFGLPAAGHCWSSGMLSIFDRFPGVRLEDTWLSVMQVGVPLVGVRVSAGAFRAHARQTKAVQSSSFEFRFRFPPNQSLEPDTVCETRNSTQCVCSGGGYLVERDGGAPRGGVVLRGGFLHAGFPRAASADEGCPELVAPHLPARHVPRPALPTPVFWGFGG